MVLYIIFLRDGILLGVYRLANPDIWPYEEDDILTPVTVV